MSLSPREARTLRFACDTLVPGLEGTSDFYARRATDLGVDVLLAQAIQGQLQPGNAKDMHRVLGVLDSRIYNLALSGRPVRFSDLGPEEREKYLAAWRDSSLGLKRTAFQALKRLTCFLAYAATGPDGLNPNWADMGYPGPDHTPPVATPEDLVLHPTEPGPGATLSCDVVVVGSGAGGGVIADAVASAGFDVLVVEQGPYERSETFKQSEMSMMQKLFQQGGTAATKDLSFVLLAGRGAGGGTTVNWNTCLKPPQRVLEEWEEDYGIAGVAGPSFAKQLESVWEGLEVNTRESQRNLNNDVLWEGCRALGFVEGVDFQTIERNAVGCKERCDYCTYGCRYACKKSTAITYLPRAQKAGARIVFDAKVDRVKVEAGSARGIEGIRTSGGRASKFEVKSKVVVVACGGIETPALLLRSGVKDKNIGRFLRLDPTVAIGGVFDRPVNPWKGPPQTVAVWKYIDLDGSYHGFWVEAAPAHPGLFALTVPWEGGRSHREFMVKNYSHSSASIVLLRERSWGAVSVDRYGDPSVTYELVRRDKETLVAGMSETARILAAAGATKIWSTHNHPATAGEGKRPVTPAEVDAFSETVKSMGVEPNRLMLFSAHLMGSCRMAADPSKGPTSPTGELHSVKNLFIGDACIFPTTPAVNPMVAIMAMALRTAESINATLRGLVKNPDARK